MTSFDSNSSTTSPSKGAYRRLLFAGACAAVATFAGLPGASAQMIGFMPDVFVDIDEAEPGIQPRGVVRRLQNRGFVEIGRPRFDGQAYIVEATHPSGTRVRLVLDAYDGALLGRRVIGQADFPQARVPRAAPGYSWTQDDPAMRRQSREIGGPIPPAEIPMLGSRRPRREANVGSEPVAPEAGPYGFNPEGKARPGPATRKSARLTQPQKPAQPQAVPLAPEAKLDSPAATKVQVETKPVEVKRDAENDTIKPQVVDTGAGRVKADPAKSDRAIPDAVMSVAPSAESAKTGQTPTEGSKSSETPGASNSPKTEAAGSAQVTPAADRSDTASKDAPEMPREQGWKDIEPAKKNVRVIDGATVVPGSEAAPSSTN